MKQYGGSYKAWSTDTDNGRTQRESSKTLLCQNSWSDTLAPMSTPDPIHRLPMEAYGMEKLDSGNEGKYLHRPASAVGFMFGKVSQAIGP